MDEPRLSLYRLITTGEEQLLASVERQKATVQIWERRIAEAKAQALESVIDAADIATQLREMGSEAFSRGKITRHRIERYWTQDEINRYNNLLQTVVDTPETLVQDRRAIDATRKSVLVAGENPRAYVPADSHISLTKKTILGGVGMTGSIVLTYNLAQAYEYSKLDGGMLILPFYCGVLIGNVLLTARVFRHNTVPQPFDSVASLIEERVATIEEKMQYKALPAKQA